MKADRFRLEGLILRGPHGAQEAREALGVEQSEGVYVPGEALLRVHGISSADRLSGLSVIGCKFADSGNDGLRPQFVDDIVIERCHFHDCGYAGAGFWSCDRGVFSFNRISHIPPGKPAVPPDSNNMYGVAFSHINTGYGQGDPAAAHAVSDDAHDLVTHPFCLDWAVVGNSIRDVNWQGIDTHGCYDFRIQGNFTVDCMNGISVTSSSNAGGSFAGWQNTITGNVCDGGRYAHTGHGLTLQGGTRIAHRAFTCTGNVIVRHGGSERSHASIRISVGGRHFVCSGNVVEDWAGVGILIARESTGDDLAAIGGVILGNSFGDCASAAVVRYCIYLNGKGVGSNVVVGNVSHARPTLRPENGVRVGSNVPERQTLSGNDFETTGRALELEGTQARGSDLPNVIVTETKTGAVTIALDRVTSGVTAYVVFKDLTGPMAVVGITGGRSGQMVVLENADDEHNVAVGSGVAKLAGGVPWVSDQYDTLMLLQSEVGGQWVEVSRSVNS